MSIIIGVIKTEVRTIFALILFVPPSINLEIFYKKKCSFSIFDYFFAISSSISAISLGTSLIRTSLLSLAIKTVFSILIPKTFILAYFSTPHGCFTFERSVWTIEVIEPFPLR